MTAPRITAPSQLPQRWAERVITLPNGCWLWTGGQDRHGYGFTKIGKRWTSAHRAIFEAANGPIPAGLEIDHRCQVRCCVNPAHLEAVTHVENMRRADSLGSFAAPRRSLGDTCTNGHLLNERNYLRDRRGWLACRDCTRDRAREYQQRRKAS